MVGSGNLTCSAIRLHEKTFEVPILNSFLWCMRSGLGYFLTDQHSLSAPKVNEAEDLDLVYIQRKELNSKLEHKGNVKKIRKTKQNTALVSKRINDEWSRPRITDFRYLKHHLPM